MNKIKNIRFFRYLYGLLTMPTMILSYIAIVIFTILSSVVGKPFPYLLFFVIGNFMPFLIYTADFLDGKDYDECQTDVPP